MFWALACLTFTKHHGPPLWGKPPTSHLWIQLGLIKCRQWVLGELWCFCLLRKKKWEKPQLGKGGANEDLGNHPEPCKSLVFAPGADRVQPSRHKVEWKAQNANLWLYAMYCFFNEQHGPVWLHEQGTFWTTQSKLLAVVALEEVRLGSWVGRRKWMLCSLHFLTISTNGGRKGMGETKWGGKRSLELKQ